MNITSRRGHMSKPKTQQHKSKPLTEHTLLPPLQKKIFLYIAENDPQDINETAKAINEHYRPSWTAFKQLEKKSLIAKVDSKIYHNREFARYWVTDDGAFIAACEGANQKRLLKRALRIYPNNRNLHFMLEITPIFGVNVFKIGIFAYASKKKIDESDKGAMIAAQAQSKFTAEELKQFSRILKKYPEQQKRFKDTIGRMTIDMQNINSLLQQPKSEEE